MKLADYIESLTVTQGQGVGERLTLMPWQRRFVRGAFRRATRTAALSVARGNGKTTLVAAIGCAAIDGPLRVSRGECVIVASSFAQARLAFDHVRAFLGDDLGDRQKWRVSDNMNTASIEHRETGARVRCIASDPRRAHGLAPALVIADEPAQWEPGKSARMLAALETSMGKIPDARLIALGTRPSDDTHWFARLLDGGADYSQCHMAGPDDPPFRARTWRKANPSLPAMPMLESAIRREAKRARHDTSSLAAFRALRLNQGVDDVLIDTLIDVESWLAAERREGDRRGRYILGVDLGSSAAMSAACAYWPETGALDAFAVFPERPSLRERGLGDAVGDVYIRMSERGELIQAGERVSDVPALFAESRHRWGDPHVVVCDRWREAELRQSLPMPAQVVTRGMGYMDGGEDVRDFRAAVLDGYVAAPESLLLRSALSNARVARDMAGNSKLAKAKDGHRDDAAAAAILAVGLGYRLRRQRPRSRRKVVQV